MVSRIISPQSPCILLSPLRALVRLAASFPIFSVCSLRLLTAWFCCCSNSLSMPSKLFLSSSFWTAFWVLLSFTDFSKASNFSFSGFTSSDIWSRFCSCNDSCFLPNCSMVMRLISFFNPSSFWFHLSSASRRNFSAWARSSCNCFCAKARSSCKRIWA